MLRSWGQQSPAAKTLLLRMAGEVFEDVAADGYSMGKIREVYCKHGE